MALVTESAATNKSLLNVVIGGVEVSNGPLLVRELPEVEPAVDSRAAVELPPSR